MVRFAVVGDYGLAGQPGMDPEGDVAALIQSWNPDFIITTGDNNYPDGEASTIDANIGQYYADYIYPYLGIYTSTATVNRFFPSLGNHDWYADMPCGAQPYFDYFTLPGNERYYDFTWGPVHFFAVDSDPCEPDGNVVTSTQAIWLQNQLAASRATWKLVYMHHPPYSSGVQGSSPALQWPYQAWGASAVLAGHEHSYERILHDGFPYFINGLGGHILIGFFLFPVPGSAVRYRDDFGAMLVEAGCAHITFQFITRTGSVIDTYTLNKSCTIYLPLIQRSSGPIAIKVEARPSAHPRAGR